MRFRIEDIVLPDQVQIAKLFECPICLGVLHDPVQTKCDHIFCAECLPTAHDGLCPVCKAASDDTAVKPLKEKNLPMFRMMSNLPVVCPYRGNQKAADNEPTAKRPRTELPCGWSGCYSELVGVHLGKCGEAPAVCSFCKVDVPRKSLSSHETQCEQQLALQAKREEAAATARHAADETQCEQRHVFCSICGESMRSEEEHMNNAAITHVAILQAQLRKAEEHNCNDLFNKVSAQQWKMQNELGKCAKTSYVMSKFGEVETAVMNSYHPRKGDTFTFRLKGVTKLLSDFENGEEWMSPTFPGMPFRISIYPKGHEDSTADHFSVFTETVNLPPCFECKVLIRIGTQEAEVENVTTESTGYNDFGLVRGLRQDAVDDGLEVHVVVLKTRHVVECDI